MNPKMLLKAVAAVATLFGIGGVAYGVDQQKKRVADHVKFHRELDRLERRV